MRGRRLAGLAVLLLALAGCGGPAPAPVGLPVGESGEVLPNLEGFVVDAAIRPLAGAVVSILFTNVSATTDEDGHFAIHRPTLAAENVLLSASLPGFKPLTQQVQITGYRSTRMDFRLDVDPRQIPRVDVLEYRGVLGCQARVAGVLIGCDPPTFSPDQGLQSSDPRVVWPIAPDLYLAGAVVELYWEAETPLMQDLHVTLRGPVIGCCASGPGGSLGEELVVGQGPSPLRLELAEDLARAFPAWSELWVEVRLPPANAGEPPGASRAQVVDIYASLFHVDAAPPGYRFG